MESIPTCEDWSEDLRFLLGRDVHELLGVYVGEFDGRLLSSRPFHAAHHRGRSTTAQYRANVAWSDGSETSESYVVACGRGPVRGATVLRDGERTVSVWNWRHDPGLPGLRRTLDPEQMTRLFADLGLRGGNVRMRVRAYRPGRRAVVEAAGDRQRLFLKVVRPDRVEQLHRLHRHLSTALVVPDSIGWTDDGVVVLADVGGVTLRDALRRKGAIVPDPARVLRLVETLPIDVGRSGLRPHWLDEAMRHASAIEATVPAARQSLRHLVDRLAPLAELDDDHELVTVHGDLYEAQIMVEGARIVGLLDVDTVGKGHRIDDVANFCAHLSSLASIWPTNQRIARYGSALLIEAERHFDRRALRSRIAGATIGLATGPFRTLEPNWSTNTRTRLDLALRWLDSAHRHR